MGKYHTNEATDLFAQACITMCKARTMMRDDIAAALRENNKRIVLKDPFYLLGEYDSDICSEIYLDEWGYVVLSGCYNRCLENIDSIQVGYLYTHLRNEGVFGDEEKC